MSQFDAILHYQEEVEVVQPTTALSEVVVTLFLHRETAEKNTAMEYDELMRFSGQKKDVNICLAFEIARRKLLSFLTSEHQDALESQQRTANCRISALTGVNDDDTLKHIAAIRKELCVKSNMLKGAFALHQKKILGALHRFQRDVALMYRNIMFALDDSVVPANYLRPPVDEHL